MLAAFRASGVELGATNDIHPDGQGPAPDSEVDGIRFLVPSLGANAGGRIFTFANQRDLTFKRSYFAGLGQIGPAFRSWVFVRDNIVVQITSDMAESQARRYEAALHGMH